MRTSHAIYLGCLSALSVAGLAFAESPSPASVNDAKPTRIEVLGEWGSGPRDNVQAVLQSTADELLRNCPERRLGTILVRRHEGTPITLFQKGPHGEHQVLLSAGDTFWNQYAYQFAHELTHILCNYDHRQQGRNLWFEESLCETASLFTMRRLAIAWKKKPPYPNWVDFAPSFEHYADHLLAARDRRLPADRTMPQWYSEHAAALEKQGGLTPDSMMVAAYLVTFFEDDPTGWQTLASLNLGPNEAEIDFAGYLRGWKARAPEKQRAFIGKFQRLFGVE